MSAKTEYIDITVKPVRRGGRWRKVKVASELRPVGVVRLGNHRGWTGAVKVITPERKVRGMR